MNLFEVITSLKSEERRRAASEASLSPLLKPLILREATALESSSLSDKALWLLCTLELKACFGVASPVDGVKIF